MATNEIIINDNDTLKDKATKTVYIFAGSSELKNQMKRLKVDYTKVQRGFNTLFVLRHKNFGRIEVKL